jgi:hypothetical protein
VQSWQRQIGFEVEFNFATATSNYTELIPINDEGLN